MESVLALMIPILALMIPISAIMVHSPVGKAWARRLEQGTHPAAAAELAELKQRVLMLEAQISEQGQQVQQLQASSEFYRELIENPEAKRQITS